MGSSSEETDMGEYLTVRQAARVAAVSPRTVRRWLDEGKLRRHVVPINRTVRVRRDELLKKVRPVDDN